LSLGFFFCLSSGPRWFFFGVPFKIPRSALGADPLPFWSPYTGDPPPLVAICVDGNRSGADPPSLSRGPPRGDPTLGRLPNGTFFGTFSGTVPLQYISEERRRLSSLDV